MIFYTEPLFLQDTNSIMKDQQEYQQELKKIHDRDFTHNWVSSSSFIFYLSVFCFLAFAFGSCFKLYNKRFENSKVKDPVVQESTMYTPKYSTAK